MKKLLALIALSLSTLSLSATAQQGDHNHALMMAIDNPQRSEANKARDVYRHPYETLSFFGVQPTHTVVEMFPRRRLVYRDSDALPSATVAR